MKKIIALSLILMACLTGCNDKNKDYVVTIHTEYGDMKVILYDETPLHKKNFIELAKSGRYDSTTWHRVIEGFMIQGGDVNTKEGTREAEEDRIPAEIVDKYIHTKGTLAAARQGDDVNPEKKSSAVQFYIVQGKKYTKTEMTTDQVALTNAMTKILNMPEYDSILQKYMVYQRANDYESMGNFIYEYRDLAEQVTGDSLDQEVSPERLEAYTTIGGAPALDHEYTVFGRVVDGLDVIDKIAAVKTGRADKPVKKTYLTMEVELLPKKKITELYGYEYPKEEE